MAAATMVSSCCCVRAALLVGNDASTPPGPKSSGGVFIGPAMRATCALAKTLPVLWLANSPLASALAGALSTSWPIPSAASLGVASPSYSKNWRHPEPKSKQLVDGTVLLRMSARTVGAAAKAPDWLSASSDIAAAGKTAGRPLLTLLLVTVTSFTEAGPTFVVGPRHASDIPRAPAVPVMMLPSTSSVVLVSP